MLLHLGTKLGQHLCAEVHFYTQNGGGGGAADVGEGGGEGGGSGGCWGAGAPRYINLIIIWAVLSDLYQPAKLIKYQF